MLPSKWFFSIEPYQYVVVEACREHCSTYIPWHWKLRNVLFYIVDGSKSGINRWYCLWLPVVSYGERWEIHGGNDYPSIAASVWDQRAGRFCVLAGDLFEGDGFCIENVDSTEVLMRIHVLPAFLFSTHSKSVDSKLYSILHDISTINHRLVVRGSYEMSITKRWWINDFNRSNIFVAPISNIMNARTLLYGWFIISLKEEFFSKLDYL